MARQATLEIQLDVEESDAEELAELTARLRRELLQLDVDSVDQSVAGEAPEGAKAVDLMVIGTLLVNLGRSAARSTRSFAPSRAGSGRARPGPSSSSSTATRSSSAA